MQTSSIPGTVLATQYLRERPACTLMLVDDDPMVREVLQAVLQVEGYRVIACEDAECAVETAARTPFDLLVTDFQMPGMNGLELAIELTKLRPGLPVLMVSGSMLQDLPMEELRVRQWQFLAKPIDRGALIRMIESEVKRVRPMRAAYAGYETR